MYKYAAFLRGINVGGKNLIKMDALRASLTALSLQDVRTYLQSGNVVFSHELSDAGELARRITEIIETDFGLKVPVLVGSIESLGSILNESPFYGDEECDPANGYIIFLSEPPGDYDVMEVERKRVDESVYVTPRAVHLYCPGGYGNTRLNNNYFESVFGVTATTRNLRTVTEILKM
ncbi:MAG: DUF1697 domain-containing protein [Bacteroidota bacterium]|jgi:uncharacterized protein (DUF1697 family)|nr:DUF1697 domain-containing protein [Saprospiraceae bacterium]